MYRAYLKSRIITTVSEKNFINVVVKIVSDGFGRAIFGKKRLAEPEGRRILMAEDMPVNAEIIMMLLSMRGMQVEHAPNGQDAFDEDVQHSLQTSMNAHLSKPVEPEHLFKTLQELIKP